MNHDGMKQGFALEITEAVCNAVSVPVIASGGAGSMTHFAEVFTKTKVSAALAASIFHFGDTYTRTEVIFKRDRYSNTIISR